MENEEKRSLKELVFDFLRGITLGVSAAVAGLSAGTIAVVEGIYDKLIGAISTLRKNFKKNVLYLLPIIFGAACGAIAAFIGIQKGYSAAPFSTTSLFAGLIFGSLPFTFNELKKGNTAKEKTSHVLSFLICLIVAAGLGIVTALTKWQISFMDSSNSIYWYAYILIIIAGFIGAFACIVPGVSGSMSLMVLGVYYPILNMYTGTDSIWHKNGSVIALGLILIVLFAIGILAGAFVGSKAMKSLLDKHRHSTFWGILGLILGSLVSMYINSSIFPMYAGYDKYAGVWCEPGAVCPSEIIKIQNWDYIVGAILFLLAASAMIGLYFFVNKKKKASEEANS